MKGKDSMDQEKVRDKLLQILDQIDQLRAGLGIISSAIPDLKMLLVMAEGPLDSLRDLCDQYNQLLLNYAREGK